MFTLRRWWDLYGVKIGLVAIVLSAAWGLRQTQASPVFEAYRLIARPFQGGVTNEDVLQDAYTRELEQKIIELEGQNQELEKLLGYVSPKLDEGIAAPIIGRSADHWWQQIVIGRGSLHGIQEGDTVVGTGGLVGRVTQVTPNTSRILLVSDPASRVGVTISRSRYMGFIRGQSEDRVVMEFFDKVPDVRPGDLVTTSTYSQLYPPGLPIGQVESVNLDKSPAPEAIIQLSAPVNYLEWVVVYENSDFGEEGALELGTPPATETPQSIPQTPDLAPDPNVETESGVDRP